MVGTMLAKIMFWPCYIYTYLRHLIRAAAVDACFGASAATEVAKYLLRSIPLEYSKQ